MRIPAARTDRLTARPSIPAVVPMLDEGRHATTSLRTLREALAALSDAFEIGQRASSSVDRSRFARRDGQGD